MISNISNSCHILQKIHDVLKHNQTYVTQFKTRPTLVQSNIKFETNFQRFFNSISFQGQIITHTQTLTHTRTLRDAHWPWQSVSRYELLNSSVKADLLLVWLILFVSEQVNIFLPSQPIMHHVRSLKHTSPRLQFIFSGCAHLIRAHTSICHPSQNKSLCIALTCQYGGS